MKKIIFFFFFFVSILGSTTRVVAQRVYPEKVDNHYIFVNKKGKKVFEKKFEEADYFREGLAAVRNEGKWGFIDKKGKTIIPLIFDTVSSFSGERAIVKKERDFF